MSQQSREFMLLGVPTTTEEVIKEPIAEIIVSKELAESGYEDAHIWVTTELMFLANKAGREGFTVTRTESIYPKDDPEVSQIIKLYGTRVQEKVLFEMPQKGSQPNVKSLN